jgi:hypothetical protein
MSNNSRRIFFSNAVKVAAVFGFAPSLVLAEERRAKKADAAAAGGALPWIKQGEGTAKALNYYSKFSDVKDAALKTERSGVAFGAKQTCATCMLYTAAGKKDGQDAGKCTLLSGGLVHAQGWCSSWSKKA